MDTNAVEQFDISEPSAEQAPVPFDIGQPKGEDIYRVPEVAKDKAEKYAYGLGENPEEIQKQLEGQGDFYLRQTAAEGESLKRRELRNSLLMRAAGKLNRPLTSADLADFDAVAKLDTNVDPATVLEEAYGKKFSTVTLETAKNPAIHAAALDSTPDLALDSLDAVGGAVAKQEIAKSVLTELDIQHQGKADQLTIGSALAGVGDLILGAASATVFAKGYSDASYKAAQDRIGLPLDYLQTLLPGYSTLKLGGWRWSTGDSLVEQYQQFALMPPTQFKKEFTETVNRLAEDNLPLAMQFANGYVQYSNSDASLDNLFSYADWIGAAASAIGAGSKLGKAARFKFTPKTETQLAQAKASPIVPNPVSKAVNVPPVTSEEQLQHVKDFRTAMKDTIKASNATTPEEAAKTLGELDASAVLATHKRLVAEFDGKDPFADGVPLKAKVASIFYPEELGKDTGSLDHGKINRLMTYSRQAANNALRVLTNNSSVVRMTPEQANKSIELAKTQLAKEFSHVNDAVLDVAHGGPFRVFTPEEQIVNVHSVELRLGRLPAAPPPPVKPKTAPPPKAGPKSTGDAFLDSVNKVTAKRGKTLARDIYDAMKSSGDFKGDFAAFRTQLSEARKGGRVKMSAHTDAIPAQQPEIKRNISVKPVPVATPKQETLPSVTVKGQEVRVNNSSNLPRDASTAQLHVKGIDTEIVKRTKDLADARSDAEVWIKSARLMEKDFGRLDEMNKRIADLKSGARDDRTGLHKKLDSLLGVDPQKVRDLRADRLKNKAQDTERVGSAVQDSYNRAYQRMEDAVSDLEKLTAKRTKLDEIASGKVQDAEFEELALPAPKAQPEAPKSKMAAMDLEEGNWASEFKRDIGHGNSSYRNRIIDSEFLLRPRSKYKSPVRAHYVEPPAGFESTPTPKKGPKAKAVYTPATVTTDEELMEAITNLQAQVAKTPNDTLYTRLSKFLSSVERRNIDNTRSPGVDNRTFDTDMIGSPYQNNPSHIEIGREKSGKRIWATRDEYANESRVRPKDEKLASQDKGFRKTNQSETALQLNTKSPDDEFVGRDYSTTERPPAYNKKLFKDDQQSFSKIEKEAYEYIAGLEAIKKTTIRVKMGTPQATLFDSRPQAAFYGANVYGLDPKRYRIMQQGNGFYISIPKMVDETYDAARDLQIVTGNKTNDRLGNVLFGTVLTPDEYLSQLSRTNRKTVTYGPQEIHRLVGETAENLADMSKPQREELRDILVANRDYKYEDEEGVVRRGRFSQTYGGFERDFSGRYKKLPTEQQTAAYFEYVQLYDLDLAMRDLALVRDVGRLGLEKTTLGFHVPGEEGAMVRKQTRAFSARRIDSLPVDDADNENFGVWIYDQQAKKGSFYLRTELNQQILDDINLKTTQHGYKILELGNPLEKPLKYAASTDEHVNFIVVKDFKNQKYDWSNIPRRPGGHVEYQDGNFVGQPVIRRSEQGGKVRHIYEGDEKILNATTEAQAQKLAKSIDDGRKLLKDGRIADAERLVERETPFSGKQFRAFFEDKVDADGNVVESARFSKDHEFTHTVNGKNTFDMAHYKDRSKNYENFVDAIRSKYNLFANNVDKKYIGQRHLDIPSVFEYANKDDQPAFTLTAPRLIDPYESVSSSLANVARSKYFNDFKIQAAENFVEEFASVMKTPIDEMRRNPTFYLHNPVWDTSTNDYARIAMGRHVRQAQLNLIGTESELGKSMSYVYQKTLNQIYERTGQATADNISETLRNAKNPVEMARAAVFHIKLGLFNVVQLFKQGATMAHASAIAGPARAADAFPRTFAARILNLTDDPAVIQSMAKDFEQRFAKIGGFDSERFIESYGELRKTGLYNVGGEYASRDDAFDPKVFKSAAGAFLDKGTIFFKEGERFPRMLGWFMAYDDWKALNPKKVMGNSDRAWVLDRADMMTVNMSRASNANIQSGLFQVPTQFFSYSFRMAEQILGTRLSRGERARVVGTQLALFGIPIGGGVGVYNFYDDIRQAALENGVDLKNPAIQALHDGVLATALTQITGEDYNVPKAYGPAGVQSIKDVISGESGMLEFLGGAVGSVAGDMIRGTSVVYDYFMSMMDPEHNAPTTQDLLDVTKNISSVNNAMKAYYMFRTGSYMTKNERTVVNDQTTTDAFMSGIFGLTSQKVGDSFLMLKSLKEKKAAEDAMGREAVKYVVRSLTAETENDKFTADLNMRRAKACLKNVPQDQWAKVLRQAAEAHTPLFERALQRFVSDAPPEQREERLNRANEEFKK